MMRRVEVLGLGNSLVDILAYADDAYLDAQDMTKGAMTLIDEERAEALYAARVDPVVVSGGSAANTIVGVASLGVRSAYIGKVKRDPLGEAFTADIRSTGVAFDTEPAAHGPATGQCFVYVTPDGERTMNTYLGASTYLAPPDVDEDLVRAAKVVYLEGYMWDRPAAKAAFQKAGAAARAAERRVALTLSDSFCVDRFRGEFIELMRTKTVDTIFSNTDELLSLYETPHFDEALDALRAEGVLGIVTRSAKGCIVVEGENTWEAPAFPIERLVDTTGAGDLFAAGFLAGL
ncbi:MAG TPA: adenosine kinase, partial [Roseiarcus sp.]|nr:adenosine kinase [Roseiarcus sp.]